MRRSSGERRVKLLVAILNKGDETRFTDAVNGCCTALSFSGVANGTAASNYVNYFGLNEIEKRVTMTLIPDYAERAVLSAVSRELKLYMVGRGIAFTLPLASVSEIISGAVLHAADKAELASKRKNEKKENNAMHELVIAVVNQKFTDAAIDAARAAGATGATLFHTRSIGNAPVEQKLGTSLPQETNTVFFLTSRAFRNQIMEAVRDAAGLKTDGGAVLFSLPVDALVGIGRFDEESDKDED